MKTTTEPRHPVHHRRLNIRSLIQRHRLVLGHPGCYITLLVPGVTDIVTGLVAVVSHRVPLYEGRGVRDAQGLLLCESDPGCLVSVRLSGRTTEMVIVFN